ncbi:hypothetical protein GCM10027286_08920 [Virgibacillus ainsalahensis]
MRKKEVMTRVARSMFGKKEAMPRVAGAMFEKKNEMSCGLGVISSGKW